MIARKLANNLFYFFKKVGIPRLVLFPGIWTKEKLDFKIKSYGVGAKMRLDLEMEKTKCFKHHKDGSCSNKLIYIIIKINSHAQKIN